jgi:hypothetical protein
MHKAGTEQQYLFTNILSSISMESLLGNAFMLFFLAKFHTVALQAFHFMTEK